MQNGDSRQLNDGHRIQGSTATTTTAQPAHPEKLQKVTTVIDPTKAITPRQLELIALVASGVGLRQIADMKFVSYATVQATLATAKTRVGARSLAHLVGLCIESGLIVRNGRGFKPVQFDGIVSE
jgi:DNA-binding CsgD family transcriptional regulator